MYASVRVAANDSLDVRRARGRLQLLKESFEWEGWIDRIRILLPIVAKSALSDGLVTKNNIDVAWPPSSVSGFRNDNASSLLLSSAFLAVKASVMATYSTMMPL